MTLGVPTGKVVLAEYSDGWPRAFSRERGRLLLACADSGLMDVEIVHIGSTAVPGLIAKPLIDIMIGLPRYEMWEEIVSPMSGCGYRHKGEWGLPGRQFFTLGEPVTHHVHVCEFGGRFWEPTLLFCRVLQRDEMVRDSYARLKVELAAKFADRREAYTAGKGGFIEGVLEEARRHRGT